MTPGHPNPQVSQAMSRSRFSLTRMDALILRTLWMPWVFGFGAFTVIGFSIGSLFTVLRRLTAGSLSFHTAIQVLGLQLPSFMVLALPMSLLLAPLVAFSQLAQRNELMVLRSCGTSLYRIVLTALIFSLLGAGCTLALSELVVPPATLHANLLLAQPGAATAFIPGQHIVYRAFRNQQLTQLFYARNAKGQTLQDVTILAFQDRQLRTLWTAKQATWNASQQQWILSQGTRYRLDPDSGLYQQIKPFRQQAIQSISPTALAMISREPLSILETRAVLDLAQNAGDQQKVRKLKVRLHSLMAFPWIGFGFGLIGAALGSQASQRGASQGFGLSIILIFAYYTFSFICQTLGHIGTLPPGLSGWLPIITLLWMGVYLLQRANASQTHT